MLQEIYICVCHYGIFMQWYDIWIITHEYD